MKFFEISACDMNSIELFDYSNLEQSNSTAYNKNFAEYFRFY